jgi:hypothetical protein
MLKSGIILGVIGFVLTIGVSIFSPLCALCIGILLGLAAGYLAGVFDRPLDSGSAAKRGAGAGALAGFLMIFGQLIAAALNAGTMQDTGLQGFNDMFGAQPVDAATIWGAQIFAACCIGLLNIGILAGLGAAGGALWGSRNAAGGGSGSSPIEPIPPAV